MGPLDRIRLFAAGLGSRARSYLEEVAPDIWGGRFGWFRLASSPGIRIRLPSRAYGTARTADFVGRMGQVVELYGPPGARLVVADISGSEPGTAPPPGKGAKGHKSHRWGLDMDTAYRADDIYSTPVSAKVDVGFLAALSAMRDEIETVGVSLARRDELQSAAAKFSWPLPSLSVWPGHTTHAHIRMRDK